MRTVILVPRRNDNGHRDALWAYCKSKWESNFPDMKLYEGHHEIGPFNRSYALNRASEAADADGRWDVALIIDSDTVSDPNSVAEAVTYTERTGGLCVAHDKRLMLGELATKRILSGYAEPTNKGSAVKKIFRDSVSCAVAIKRSTWDIIGGFDERFEGWGFEDTAFHIACETVTGLPIQIIKGDCFHLWHAIGSETSRNSPTFRRNHSLKRQYEAVRWQRDRLLRMLDPTLTETPVGHIPRIFHRTVPEVTSETVEGYWMRFQELHPDWEFRTYREPINPADWPILGDLHDRCQNGAQKAGLIRLEAILAHGGVYIDSDVEPMRSFESLLPVGAFAGWEDEKVVPDAVLGGTAGHPAFVQLVGRAREAMENGQDAWHSGPGGTTEVLPGRTDVLLLPPGAFYPAHYLERDKLGKNGDRPWVFCEHKWAHSWGTDEAKERINKAQRVPAVMRKGAPPKPETPLPPPIPSLQVPEDLKVAVCIPWNGSGDIWRQESLNWCANWWLKAGLKGYLGDGESRSAMRNAAARQAIAEGAEILFFADADTFVPIQQMIDACRSAKESGKLTHAFTSYIRLGSSTTKRAQMSGIVDIKLLARQGRANMGHMSGALAVPRELLIEIGGYDERFTDWGHEDRAFEMAAATLGRGINRIGGPAIHWYHEPASARTARLKADDPIVELMIRYCRASGIVPDRGQITSLARKVVPKGAQPDQDAMRALLSDDGGPLVTAQPS